MKTKAQRRWELYGQLGQLKMVEKIINNVTAEHGRSERLPIINHLDKVRDIIHAKISDLKAKP